MIDARPPSKIAITGVSQGLGRALAQAFAVQGIQVYGSTKRAAGVVFPGLPNGALYPAIMTASAYSPAQMAEFAAVAQTDGPVDIVIANAGTVNIRRPLWEIPETEWREVLNVNVMGVVETARAFLPSMIASGRGLFIAVSSSWGRSTSFGLGPYCASKFAVEGLVGVLNDDLPPGLRAIALDPGNGINTNMLKSCLPDEHDTYISAEAWAEYATADILTMYRSSARGSLTVNYAL